MSRIPHQPAELGDTAGPMPAGHAITIAGEQETADIESEMAFKAAEAIGMLKALEFSETVSARAKVEVFLNLGKSKAYKAIFVTDDAGNRKRISDLDEFCERFIGKSARRMRQQAASYHLLGGDLFEASQRIGFRQQDYDTLKALPADDQEIIKQAMQAEDRAQVIDLIQEMAVRHASEKAALKTQASEAEETAAARDDVIKAKEATISKLELRATSAERRHADFTDIDEAGYECAPLHQAVADTIVGLKKIEREVARLMHEVGGDIVMEECVTAVLVAARRAVEINREYRLGIPDATMLDIIDEDERQAIELRALGLTPAVAIQ